MLKQHSDMYGSNDWLSEEIRKESRISAWDMDGGKLLREEHEAGCDARRLAAEHALDCDAESNAEMHRKEHRGSALDAGFRDAMRKANAQENGNGIPEGKEKIVAWALIGGFVLIVLVPPLATLLPILAIGYVIYAANRKDNQ